MAWASASTICHKLHGHFRGHKGMARCPAHEDSTPSLSVEQTRDGRVLVFCFGGCDQFAVIDALRKLGLWGDGELVMDPNHPFRYTTKFDGVTDRNDRARRRDAQDIWDRHQKISGTKAETYIRGRGINMPLGDQLGYIPSLKHHKSGRSLPALVARVSDEAGFCAIQRTYLAADGSTKADVESPKMTFGPMAGGAVRLFPVSAVLGLAEGIETALSAAQLYRVPVWATLSANRLGKIEIPETVGAIMIFADSGKVGVQEAFSAQDFYERRGLTVEVVTPGAHFGAEHDDFNSVAQARYARAG